MAPQPNVWQVVNEDSDTTPNSKNVTLEFIARNTMDRDSAESMIVNLADSVAPAGLGRQRATVKHLGCGIWRGVVTYGSLWTQVTWSGDFLTETSHIVQSFRTVAAYAAPGFQAPNFHGAIGVNGDSLAGTDVPTPKASLTASVTTHYINVGTPLMGALYSLGGYVNDSPIYITPWDFCNLVFQPGELMYQGATWGETTDTMVNLQLNFSASPNATGLQVGDISITGTKRGWDHIWALRLDDEENYEWIKRPQAAYVEEVSQYGDLSVLGVF